jgi:hypothetical protein
MDRLLLVGLDEPEQQALRERLPGPITCYEMLPRIQVKQGQLFVESMKADDRFLPVARVVFHGIFEDDLPFLAALALWGGPCFPRARGMMDCRQRLPCLVRALAVTRFGALQRGYADRRTAFETETDTVAKFGEWHCGENKERFRGRWVAEVPTLFERFVEGEAVRIQMIGDRAWQFRLGGEDWKKSIHHATAGMMAVDEELLEDTRRLQEHFGLEIVGVDYVVGADGGKYLLEVNHIPSVTAFAEVREAYLERVVSWVAETGGSPLRGPRQAASEREERAPFGPGADAPGY